MREPRMLSTYISPVPSHTHTALSSHTRIAPSRLRVGSPFNHNTAVYCVCRGELMSAFAVLTFGISGLRKLSRRRENAPVGKSWLVHATPLLSIPMILSLAVGLASSPLVLAAPPTLAYLHYVLRDTLLAPTPSFTSKGRSGGRPADWARIALIHLPSHLLCLAYAAWRWDTFGNVLGRYGRALPLP